MESAAAEALVIAGADDERPRDTSLPPSGSLSFAPTRATWFACAATGYADIVRSSLST
jgi:hypothetical protein